MGHFNKQNLVLVLIILCISCNKPVNEKKEILKKDTVQVDTIMIIKDTIKDTIKVNTVKEPIIDKSQWLFDEPGYRKLVIEKGDIDAYDRLRNFYLLTKPFLRYALIMADKYDYTQAYFDVFSCIEKMNKKRPSEKEMKKGIRYLKVAALRNHHQAPYYLGELYMEGKYMPKDTVLGKYLMQRNPDMESIAWRLY
jgi:hypothetical protein